MPPKELQEVEDITDEYLSKIKFSKVEEHPPMEFAKSEIDENSAEYAAFAEAIESWTKHYQPPFVTEYVKIQEKMLDTVIKKNHDYSGDVNPFRNFELVEHLGVATTEEGFVVRMADKLMRISNLLRKEAKVSDESVEDTLMDLANYAMLLSVYRKINK